MAGPTPGSRPSFAPLRRYLDAGHLGIVERSLDRAGLNSTGTAWSSERRQAVAGLRGALADRRAEEAAKGGHGSLVIPDHRLTRLLIDCRARLG